MIPILHAVVPILHTVIPILHAVVPILHAVIPVLQISRTHIPIPSILHTVIPILHIVIPILHAVIPILDTVIPILPNIDLVPVIKCFTISILHGTAFKLGVPAFVLGGRSAQKLVNISVALSKIILNTKFLQKKKVYINDTYCYIT